MPRRSVETPHPIDIIAGRNLRLARTRRGVSQGHLGEVVGISFQQVQKYELGKNRMSLSRAYEFAEILHINPADFYAGADVAWPPSFAMSKQFDHWLALFLRAHNSKLESEVIRCVNDIISLADAAFARSEAKPPEVSTPSAHDLSREG